MWVKLDRVINEMKSAVPEEMWGDIVEKLEDAEHDSKGLNVTADAFDDGTDPDEFADFDDELAD